MQIEQNISLKPYNTFGIHAMVAYFTRFESVDDLSAIFDLHENRSTLIIGGGSNILLTKDYDGLVAKNEMKGIEVLSENEQHIYLKAAAGENWHQFVLYCIENNYAGVENLSLIPGNVGASPMQNIGAYGVELKDVFHELEAFHIRSGKVEKFSSTDCEFGYRESVFKRTFRGEFVITAVTFKLNKHPVYNIQYGAIQQELDHMDITQVSIAAISQAVINIRQSKLPDPKVIGNAGSFFKNPTIQSRQFEQLQKEHPGIVGYPQGINQMKVAAGWLIEQCGWKGYRKGDAGCHSKQALVLINYGDARGADIYNLSSDIMESVQLKFNIALEREVNVLG